MLIIEFANLFEHHFKVQRNTGETSTPQKLDSETAVDVFKNLLVIHCILISIC